MPLTLDTLPRAPRRRGRLSRDGSGSRLPTARAVARGRRPRPWSRSGQPIVAVGMSVVWPWGLASASPRVDGFVGIPVPLVLFFRVCLGFVFEGLRAPMTSRERHSDASSRRSAGQGMLNGRAIFLVFVYRTHPRDVCARRVARRVI